MGADYDSIPDDDHEGTAPPLGGDAVPHQLVIPMQLRWPCCDPNSLAGEARRDHDGGGGLRAYCALCGANQGYTFGKRETLGLRDRFKREDEFLVPDKIRRRTLVRDGFRCVHCGRAAPRESTVTAFVREILDEHFGESWRRLDPTLGTRQDPCGRCGQFLPGFALTVPRELLAKLPEAAMRRLFDVLENSSLEMDHGIPVAILKHPKFVLKKAEREFCTEVFIVTSCPRCNLGLGSSLEPKEFYLNLLRTRIFRNDDVNYQANLPMLLAIHLKANAVGSQLLRDAG